MPAKLSDLTGFRSGRLEVLRKAPPDGKRVKWLCRCDCGKECIVPQVCLRRPNATQSCGCLRDETTVRRNLTHGHTGTPTYGSWQAMIVRCENPNRENYDRYGGANIRVCKEWRESFENFLADMGERPAGTTIDRIDATKGYEPGNCRWATTLEQANNKRDSLRVELDGRSVTVAELSREFGISPYTIYNRLRRGATVGDAVKPKSHKTLTLDGRTASVPEWAKETGLSPFTIYARLKKGASVQEALRAPRKTVAFDGRIATVPEWAKETGLSTFAIYHRLARGDSPEEILGAALQRLRSTG